MLQKPLQHQEHGFGHTVRDMYEGSLDTRNTHTTQATVIHDEYLVRTCATIHLVFTNSESAKHPCMEQLTEQLVKTIVLGHSLQNVSVE